MVIGDPSQGLANFLVFVCFSTRFRERYVQLLYDIFDSKVSFRNAFRFAADPNLRYELDDQVTDEHSALNRLSFESSLQQIEPSPAEKK